MIRKNLLRSKVGSGSVETAFETSIDVGGGSGSGSANTDSVIKIVLIIVFSLGLYIYEGHIVDTLNQKANSLRSQLLMYKKRVDGKKQQAGKVKDSQKKVQELEGKLDMVKTLSRVRLNELKALDFLQNIIPEKVWLTSISYKDKGFEMQGGAIDDNALTDFIEKLQGKGHFKDVVLLKAADRIEKTGPYKVFILSSQLGGEG